MTTTEIGPLFVGIDLGTSSVKVVVIDDDGRVVATAHAPYPVSAPHPGWAETGAQSWWDAVVQACRTLPSETRSRCAGIGLSGQMHGLVATDDDLRPLRPAMLHADTRAHAELDRYRELSSERIARLANPLSPNMAGPMLVWLAAHEPDLLARTRWALQPKDWIRWRLTGQVASEPSDASATLLYDVAGDDWAFDVVDALGLPAGVLPPVLPRSDVRAGALTPTASEALGLPAGVAVAAGGGDTAVAMLGSGLLGERAAGLTIGTGGQIVVPMPETPVSSNDPVTHTYRDVASGWYAMAAVLNAGLALDWVRRTTNATWPELYGAAAHPAAPDAPVFVPHLVGERTPYLDPGLRASWSGLGLSHTREDLLRAALEGVAFNLRVALDALPPTDDVPLLLAGGGTRDTAWRRLLADVLERPLHPLTLGDVSGRGAAILGALAAGHVDPEQVRARWRPERGAPTLPADTPDPALAGRRERHRAVVDALR